MVRTFVVLDPEAPIDPEAAIDRNIPRDPDMPIYPNNQQERRDIIQAFEWYRETNNSACLNTALALAGIIIVAVLWVLPATDIKNSLGYSAYICDAENITPFALSPKHSLLLIYGIATDVDSSPTRHIPSVEYKLSIDCDSTPPEECATKYTGEKSCWLKNGEFSYTKHTVRWFNFMLPIFWTIWTVYYTTLAVCQRKSATRQFNRLRRRRFENRRARRVNPLIYPEHRDDVAYTEFLASLDRTEQRMDTYLYLD